MLFKAIEECLSLQCVISPEAPSGGRALLSLNTIAAKILTSVANVAKNGYGFSPQQATTIVNYVGYRIG